MRAESNDPAGVEIALQVASCNADPTAQVEERSDEVIVRVTRSTPKSPFGGPDCADAVVIELEAPLLDRPLIDGRTGEDIVVTYHPWNQARFSRETYVAALETAAACVRDFDPSSVVEVVDGEVPMLDIGPPELDEGETWDYPSDSGCYETHVAPLTR